MNLKINPYLEIILATVIWGTSGPFVKWIDLPPTSLAFFRTAIPTLFLFGYFRVYRVPLFKGPIWIMLIASLLSSVRIFFYFTAYQYTSIGNAVIMLYTWPIFGTILSSWMLKEVIPPRNIFLLFIAFAGIVLVASRYEMTLSGGDFLGMCSMLTAGLLHAITVIIFKQQSEVFSRNETIFYQNLAGLFIFLPFLIINRPFPTVTQWAISPFYGLWIGVIAFGLFFEGLKRINASTASILTYFEVVFAVAFGVLFFNEVLTWQMVTGGILIILSTAFLKKG